VKIAFLGSRGIPARYSGFETFYEQLAVRLVQKGHHVTVYNRSHFIQDVKNEYKGVRLISLPSIPTKHLDTLTHTALSSLHALFQNYDVVYYCIVGNSPLVWVPRLGGAKTLLNVDGEDWAREKWSGFARWYQRCCEWVAPKTATVIIADSMVIQRRYSEVYGVDTVFVPYGANVERDEGTEVLDRWGLESRRYLLYVGRFVPENAIDLLIQAFLCVKTDMKLVLIGDAPHSEEYKRALHASAASDPRVVFTGYAFGRDYAQLSSHAYLAVQPSAVNGTRPALLDQMGFGNGVVVRNSPANQETVADCGCTFDQLCPLNSLAETLQALIADPGRVAELGMKARRRIDTYYNWDWITNFYLDLFERLTQGRLLINYHDFLKVLADVQKNAY